MLLLALKSYGSAVVRFLGSLSLLQILCLGLALFAGLQTIRLHGEQRHSAKVEARLRKATDALDKLAAESKSQQKQVQSGIDQHKSVVKPDAEKRARVIENAPAQPDCRSSPEVLAADI